MTAGHQEPHPLLPYPFFTLQERDRRWALVRQAMERDNVDCLVVANSTGDYQITWGDTVAVTPKGARRLGRAPQGIMVARG